MSSTSMHLPSLAECRKQYGLSARPDIGEWLDQQECGRHITLSAIAKQLAWDYLLLEQFRDYCPRFDLIAFAECVRRGVAVLSQNDQLIVIAVNPFAEAILSWVDTQIGQLVERYLVDPAEFTAFLALVEGDLLAADGMLDVTSNVVGGENEGLTLANIADSDSPVVRQVNALLYDAWNAEASDIHIETTDSGLRFRYRLDGVLVEMSRLQNLELAEQILSRIKVMAELDIAERRIPQDGRFKMVIRGHAVDFRVSIMPSIFGEDAVLRLLDRRSLSRQMESLSLSLLGFDPEDVALIDKLAKEPYGMLLVTGPTGSGKTTSLYAAVESLDRVRDKIITIEDPVEYQLHNALQIPVNEKKGLTFAKGLRSILRHDPDTILVGEIRDSETAQIAIQAALTGHLVLTSVHANHTFDVIGRLLHMGVDPYNFVSALNGIVAQRLIRLNCPECLIPTPLDETVLAASGLSRETLQKFNLQHGKGCAHCRGTGYKGRLAIAEVLILDDDLRERILAREPISQLKRLAQEKGMRSLRESALAKVSAGISTFAEINRVTAVPAHTGEPL